MITDPVIRSGLENVVGGINGGDEQLVQSALLSLCRALGGNQHVIYTQAPAYAMIYVLTLALARS